MHSAGVIATAASNRDDLYRKGRHLLDSGRADQALMLFSDLLTQEPDNLEAQFMLGVCYFRLAKFETVEDTFAHLHSLGNNDYRAAYYLGLARERQGRLLEAQVAYRKALNMNPNLQEARDKLSRVNEDLPASGQRLNSQSTPRPEFSDHAPIIATFDHLASRIRRGP